MSNKPDNAGKIQDTLVEFQDPRTVQSQAAKWLAELDAETLSKADAEEFQQWINENEVHREKFEDLMRFWDELNILTQIVTPREKSTRRITRHRQTISRQPCYKAKYVFSGVVSVLILVLSIVLIRPTIMSPSSPLNYTTEVGEQRNITLSDGTSALLNTNSRIKVYYDEQSRSVFLTQGEVHFDVFRDSDIPFEVYAGNGLVRALGTAFTVHLMDKAVEVVVTEGVVEIGTVLDTKRITGDLKQSVSKRGKSPEKAHNSTYTKVPAGNRAIFRQDAITQIQLAQVSKMEEELSWREGMLMFEGEPLEQVVNEMGRYTSMKILIPEREIRELMVGGIFKIGDTVSLFEALQEGFDIRVEYVSDDFVYLVSNVE